jgi:serine/threonine protein phosphatase PrpC
MEEEQETTAPLEAESLEEGWAARASRRPRCHAYLAVGAKTDLGQVRENNEDKFEFLEPDDPSVLATKGRVYAVADGMGGHSAGQIASELSLKVFIRSYYSDTSPNVEDSLTRAVKEANAYVVDVARTIPGRNGMGATLTAAVVRDDDLYIAQVGDSRCYLLREGRLEQITEDHSWVAEQVRLGSMTQSEAEQSPFRNVITRSMGGSPEVEPDLLAVKIQQGDRYLLCSDGLSGMVSDEELTELLGTGSPSVIAWKMVDRANEQGGKDNITALILQVQEICPWPEEADGEGAEGAEPNGREEGEIPREARPVSDAAKQQCPPGKHRNGIWGRFFHRP